MTLTLTGKLDSAETFASATYLPVHFAMRNLILDQITKQLITILVLMLLYNVILVSLMN